MDTCISMREKRNLSTDILSVEADQAAKISSIVLDLMAC
jgi:hypothetical protein